MQTIEKTLFSIKGNVLGEVISVDNDYGFFHVETSTEQFGFDSVDAAYDALFVFHTEYFESL